MKLTVEDYKKWSCGEILYASMISKRTGLPKRLKVTLDGSKFYIYKNEELDSSYDNIEEAIEKFNKL